ncbi:MAG: twin-arginine translocase subunit TatC [Candidatus Omnitrophica bacterium]|nr:twin-arginine translocase subunit TatC [Candidatus Omnitrophota bacterium]MCB9784480.1 twin-arginine translocase subunit TatC [Candidatus Omnitrophota bacterium]
MSEEKEMSFMEHLEELRDRILRAVYGIVPAMVICFIFARDLLELITNHARSLNVPFKTQGIPLRIGFNPVQGVYFDIPISSTEGDTILQALSPIEIPICYMKVAFVAAIFVAFPWIMYQAWAFIEPGLKPNEKKYIGPFLIVSWSFFIFGGLFAYFGMLTVAVKLLANFGAGIAVNAWSLSNYVSFVLRMLLVFGIVFQMPVVSALLSMLGILDPEFLAKYRRHSILGITIAAAILTPPDPVTLVIMAIPLYGLFELSIVVARFFKRKPGVELTPAKKA